jgi:transglutaminase-like putative cysteine protease
MKWTPLDITIRVGCHVVYETSVPTPICLVLRPRLDGQQMVREEKLSLGSCGPTDQFEDSHGNLIYRTLLQPGQNIIHHDALVDVASTPEDQGPFEHAIPVSLIPPRFLRYTLPSRYCDSDKLMDLAWSHFGQIPNGYARIQAICDWVHHHIEYRYGSGRSDLSASEVIARGYGVCRDYAHAAIALCRAFNLPARYVTGHLPDIGCLDGGHPMDFHAYLEVYLGHEWYTFDARFNTPRIGRIKMAQGLDAVDGAFSTIYGQAQLAHFEVWAYQVNPHKIRVGHPVNLNDRMDGSVEVRLR